MIIIFLLVVVSCDYFRDCVNENVAVFLEGTPFLQTTNLSDLSYLGKFTGIDSENSILLRLHEKSYLTSFKK